MELEESGDIDKAVEPEGELVGRLVNVLEFGIVGALEVEGGEQGFQTLLLVVWASAIAARDLRISMFLAWRLANASSQVKVPSSIPAWVSRA